jgi:hypothetical protein
MVKCISAVCVLVMMAGALCAQPAGSLKGQVTDESGALVPGAKVTAVGPGGAAKVTTSGPDGSYALIGLAPGSYTVQAAAPGLKQFQPVKVEVAGGAQSLNLQLRVTLENQEVTVQESTTGMVSTDPSSNAGALVLKQEDLQALSDDPDDLANDLQALAGPAAGPSGGQIYIDGFTGGRLPPKESIREIRINQNPFSAEYDKLGFGRIEILTKPGSDKFRGQAFFSDSNGIFNSRNPLSPNKPDYQSRQYGGNLSGPLSKRASFFVDFERREIDDNAIIDATIVDPSLNITPFAQAVLTPQRRTTVSPRIDYQLTSNVTLTGRYTFTRNDVLDAGIGDFSLPERAFSTLLNEHTAQLTATAVLNPRTINETRFQFIHLGNAQNGNTQPTINVLQAFEGGGSGVGLSFNTQNRFELQNYTSLTWGAHSSKFGVRVRAVDLSDVSQNNFGGTFVFAANPALNLSSIQVYQQTLLGLQQGLSIAQIRAQTGAGPSQFLVNAGNPSAALNQVDLGFYFQDDWRLKPNFTLSLGLRYETQTNIHDWRDLAPRLGFAWAPGQGASGGPFARPKTVIRGGFGIFYDRFSENYTLTAERFNGLNQQQIRIFNPDFFLNNIPAISTLQGSVQNQAIHEVDQNLRAPYIVQTAIGVERQIGSNTSVAVNFTDSRGLHLLRSRDINAPLPGSGVRPFGPVGEIDVFESTGILNQKQLITNINTRVGRNLSLFGGYFLNFAKSDTDGALTFPSNNFDLHDEYGRSVLDVRHRLVLGGSINTKWNLRLSPFIIARSGIPFNITTGTDINGDSLFTDRPAFATAASAQVFNTRFGVFDAKPQPGETIIPRNFAEGPGQFTVNLRLSKTFGFGGERNTGSARGAGAAGAPSAGAMRMGPGGPRGGGHDGGRGMGGMFSDPGSTQRYNMTFSVQARNLFNTTNLGTPIGNLTSPLFGQSNTLANLGPGGSSANNRRVELQVRFSF